MANYVVNQGYECSFEECSKPARNKKLCNGHYTQMQRGKDLTPLRPRKSRYVSVCSFKGCPLQHYSKGYCKTHARQLERGEVLKTLKRKNLWEDGRKICPGCGIEKGEDEYHKLYKESDRFQERCKECRSQYRRDARA
jgi:hypothetical protein